MGFTTPDAPEHEWQALLESKFDAALPQDHERVGAIEWVLPPWEHYLNGTSGPPGYVEVSAWVTRTLRTGA